MASCSFQIIDVFTRTRWTGNPLAVVTDAHGLDSNEMQAIAKEFNLSETTFVGPKASDGAHPVRIFTPVGELPFAGHPTLGTAWHLLGTAQSGQVVLRLPIGDVPIDFRERDGAVYGEMVQPPAWMGMTHEAETIARLAGVAVDDLVPGVPLMTTGTGLGKITVPLKSLEAIRRIKPDSSGIAQYCEQTDKANGFYYITREVDDAEATFHARNILSWTEDPVTGSAAGACLVWLAHVGWIESGQQVVIEQGSEVGRPGKMYGTAFVADGTVTAVKLGGYCVPVASGTLEA